MALSFAPPAFAERIDPSLFNPGFGTHALMGLETSAIAPHGAWYVGLGFSHANGELVATDANGIREVAGLLSDRTTVTLGLGLALWERFEISAALPYIYSQAAGTEASTHSVGDVRLAVKGRIFGGLRGFSLGAQAYLSLPTATYIDGADFTLPRGAEIGYDGHGGLSVGGRLLADWRSARGSVLTLSAGYFHRPTRSLLNLEIGDELRVGLGVELTASEFGGRLPLSFLFESDFIVGLGAEQANVPHIADTYSTPLELRAGLRWRGPFWMFTGGVGVGITDGYGSPDYRALAKLEFGSGAGLQTEMGRGDSRTIAGSKDHWEPSFAPLGVPAQTVAPQPKVLTKVNEAGETIEYAVETALPDKGASAADPRLALLAEALKADPDPDLDGILGEKDLCPTQPEDFDGFQDEDGCPDPDNDGDGIPDALDKCPLEPEVFNGIDDEDGCPDKGESRVVARADQIELRDSVEFETGSDILKPTSLPLLQQVASVLKANPQVKLVRVEGHTDNVGNAEMNVDLSERRAGRVVQTLIQYGVEGSRMRQRGFGPTRPVAPNTTKDGRQKNRRVDFRIIDPAPPGKPRIEVDDIGEEKAQ